MNQVQRKYLIDKIKEKANTKIKALESLRTEKPKIENHIVTAIMSGTIKYRSIEDIAGTIRKKVLASKDSHSVFRDRWGSSGNKIELGFDELFIIPEKYAELVALWQKEEDEIYAKIREISLQLEGLETRIMLASDKVLQGVINDIDDMGNLALVDVKLKALTA